MIAKAEVFRRIRDIGVIPVVRADSTSEAIRIAEALAAGGLPALEITLTVPGALRVIERLATAFREEALVGAGSVLDAESARRCIAAGARFIVGPVLNAEVIAHCRGHDVAVLPGALTPTEVAAAWSAGADFVKVFPADAMGGPGYIRSLKAPMPHLELVPTGGVTLASVAEYLAAGAAAVGVGADLVRGEPASITAAARAYVEAVRAARGH